MKTRTLVILIVIFLAGVFFIMRPTRPPKVTEIAVEDRKKVFKPAPEFALFDIYGEEKRLSDYKGKVIILNFWATWCPPCRVEIPHFVELYEEHRDDGLEIIGIALDVNAERIVPDFAKQNGINYTTLIGNKDMTDLYGGIMSIPTTFVIDRNGGIRERYIGYQGKEVFERDIKELL
ncbi:MAG: TlpA family protein disulfide reductase [Candidatus Omnitrophica bacterium]|nr:TlpA family protein disulfide reductase [Candidatus Omnitrophota bacterium]